MFHPSRPTPGPTRSLFAALIGCAVMLATGCGEAGTEENTAGDEGEFPRTVDHAMGETTLESEPDTVVALDTALLDAAIALEATVVGRTQYADGPELRDYLGQAGETYAGDSDIVGTLEAPDLAEIAALEPDVILSANVRHEDIYDQLSEIAPTVFTETVGAPWKENLELVATALGAEERATQLLADYDERTTELAEEIVAANGGAAPTVALGRFAGEPTMRLYGPDSFFGVIQQDLGLPGPPDAPEIPEDQIMAEISQEEILDIDADHIFVAQWQDGSGESAEQADTFTTNPLWGQLTGQQHDVDDRSWVSSTSILGAEAVLDDISELLVEQD
ncbi:iron-siderophore ABC transporter substrate-binding protein [Lipingzhangella sp. LS1_29]|uniref:Iron-siderophore ABC transporter substrate-binding protein n=1 Tax=Lipingzhangella rawalii TaxID=2055835 RepID=A0ABU2H7F9_9ACTN|nr:iron-siderophore ABC transporter substrate-binding protein [Lipingzhangella rawalii]MDS1271238.1 iron-siderophore ABC transporter substrate-binding protein [Lipingzhangella rawalii]